MAPLAQRGTTANAAASPRDQLILEHMPQVRLIARRIQERLPQHISLEDLISTGVVGLIAAIDHFDPRHNVKLKTYAEYKIRGAILDSLREMDWVPRQRRRKARQIETAVAAAEQQLQRPPTEEETAAELQVSLQQFREWLLEVRGHEPGASAPRQWRRSPQHHRDAAGQRGEPALARSGKSRVAPSAGRSDGPASHASSRWCCGMYYQEGMTLREIAHIAHVHESRISQLKTQAIVRLRKRMRPCWPTVRGA